MKKRRKMFVKRMAAAILTVCMIMGMTSFTVSLDVQAAGSPSWNSSAYNNSNPFAASGYYGQCTWYAWGRAYELMGKSLPCKGNARTWYDVARNAGWSVGSEPRANSIAVWNKNYGHVAYVENVSGSSVTISEANFRTNYLDDQCWDLSVGIQYYDGTRTLTASQMQNRYGTLLGYIYLGAPEVTTPPIVSEGKIIGADEGGYMIQCRVTGSAVSSVKVASWVDGNGQSDLKWNDMVRQSDGATYKLYVAYSDHGNIAGNYQNHIYAYNPAGEGVQSVYFSVEDKPGVTMPPIVSEGKIIGVDAEGYMIQCRAIGSNVTSVKVASWVDGNGQGDLKWNDMVKQSDGVTYKLYVAYSDHGNIVGNYQNHIYAYNSAGEGVQSVYFSVEDKPEISDIHIADADVGGYTIECKIDSYNLLSDAQVATWTTSNGQDDLQWENLECQPDGLTYRCYVPYSSHNYEKGSYENLVCAKSITGEESQMIIHCNELHNWDAGSVLKETGCNEPGLKEYTCIACNETKREEISAVGHRYSENWYYDEVKHWHIAICGHDLKSDETEHKFAWVIDRAATQENTGIKHEECGTCGCMRNEGTVIDAVDSISLSQISYVYNGKTKKPSVKVKNSSGKMLRDKTDYTVYYSGKAKNVGSYTVTITLKGNYSGIVKKTFEIVPKGTSISKISARRKGFAIKWKKQTKQTSGYEIAYSTSNKFVKKNTKTVTVKKNKNSSKSISKLKAKKKYYVRIRTYKTIRKNGRPAQIYSAWSKVRMVTTKKRL